jgi:hypothetical protein
MTRDQFIILYERFELEYSNALKKADLEYQEVIASVKAYQKIVSPIGEEIGKELKNFVTEEKLVLGGTQKTEIYFYKEKPLTLTIPSGIEGYPDFGPFDIDPVDHVGDETNPADTKLSSEKLSAIYGKIVSGYTSPILFKYLEVNFLLDEVSYLRKEVDSLKLETKELREDVRILKVELAILTGGASAIPNAAETAADALKAKAKKLFG